MQLAAWALSRATTGSRQAAGSVLLMLQRMLGMQPQAAGPAANCL